MQPKVFVTRPVPDPALAMLEAECHVKRNDQDRTLSPEELAERLSDRDGVLCQLTDRMDAALLEKAPSLRVIANIAVGYDNVDVGCATRRGILVTNTPGVLTETTADFTFALLLAAARRVVEADRFVRAGQWKQWKLDLLLGKDVSLGSLGIIGLGRIGRAVARRARGFDMSVLYWQPRRADPEVEQQLGVIWVSQETLLREADFITLHVPLKPETHHLIGAAELAQMKPPAILINTARGPVVDEEALAEALQQGRIRGAGLDVFEREPQVHPVLLTLPNVVLAPHIASASEATRRRMAEMAAQNLLAALRGEVPPNLVNPEALGAPMPPGKATP
ncbi:MAG: D-glycerate dehydrogenase [Acidobacteria bacterium]|nr:D-glycerate dehydrogenase [Acidobacteriota bacterium]